MVGNNTPSSSTINDRVSFLIPLASSILYLGAISISCPKMIHACGCLISLTIESRNALNIRYIHLEGGGGDILPFLSSF
ncbi:hypothetical protein RhiirA5_439160 [Rhizophagus irregularis]|uniref:Uncharacterized protein n=1 Tax=Rhizophagus irregularis TaxID=588596 RepID=A0A2N0NI74_9GLOM|nr:hypothetical protein RhiirA5_439160 [Rhizophagus irregularis]